MFKGKKVLIMGLGLLGGGVGAARFFAKKGAIVTVTDLKTKDKLASSTEKLKDLPISYVLGKHKKEDFINADLIIRNPDVMPDSPFLQLARRHGVNIEMVESFFAKHCPSPIIGVTGTRGKSTTASLIFTMLKNAGRPTVLAGNMPGIGTLDFLDRVTPNTYVVLELSSFQLHGFGESKISPQIAVITNIYPEHLNHYKTLKDYIDDKKNIFCYQNREDFLILNKKSKYTKGFDKVAKSQVFLFDKNDIPQNWQLKLPGPHNRENVAAAAMVGKILNVPNTTIKETMETFNTLPYHLQEIRTIKNTIFINDGISTSPEATIAALQSFTKPVLLIVGGNDKLLDFKELGKLVDIKARAVFLMSGSATPKIKKAISSKTVIKGTFASLQDVVLAAYKYAKNGDIILFSPAATSFNWFNNVYHRSREFEKIVMNI